MYKYEFDGKYGNITFYDRRKTNLEYSTEISEEDYREPEQRDYIHPLTFNTLEWLFLDSDTDLYLKLEKLAEKHHLPDLIKDFEAARLYENAYAATKQLQKGKEFSIKQVGKTKLKKADIHICDYSTACAKTLLDIARMLDELIKQSAHITASIDNEVLHVNYKMPTVTGRFQIPAGTWINIVRESNPNFTFLPVFN